MSHRGRPVPTGDAASANGDNSVSLFGNVAPLERAIGAPVTPIKHFHFDRIREMLRAAPAKSVYLMENVRLLKGEETNSPRLAKTLASLGTIYVNDAFAAAHRTHASVVGITRYLPSYAGLLMERECAALRDILRNVAHPFVVIIGGVKAWDKMPVIRRLMPRADAFLFGGSVANTILKAAGTGIGDSVYDPEFIALGTQLAKNKKVVLLRDWLWDKNKILDIGPQTIGEFVARIKKAKTVLWNGPLGQVEDTRYAAGSVAVAEAVAKSRALSVVGGGETTQLIRSLNLQKKISLLSTGGGAMLEFLAGKKLPGVEALK